MLLQKTLFQDQNYLLKDMGLKDVTIFQVKEGSSQIYTKENFRCAFANMYNKHRHCSESSCVAQKG